MKQESPTPSAREAIAEPKNASNLLDVLSAKMDSMQILIIEKLDGMNKRVESLEQRAASLERVIKPITAEQIANMETDLEQQNQRGKVTWEMLQVMNSYLERTFCIVRNTEGQIQNIQSDLKVQGRKGDSALDTLRTIGNHADRTRTTALNTYKQVRYIKNDTEGLVEQLEDIETSVLSTHDSLLKLMKWHMVKELAQDA